MHVSTISIIIIILTIIVIRCGHLNVVNFLVEEKKCNFEAKDKRRQTPLHLAVQ